MNPDEQEAKYRAVIKRTLERAKEIDEARKAAAKKHPMPKLQNTFTCTHCGSRTELKFTPYGDMRRCTNPCCCHEEEA